MSDLIKRLRDLAEDLQIVPGIDTESSELVYRAASRIEELEGALRDAYAFIDSHVADPDITKEMRDAYAKMLDSRERVRIVRDE